MLTPEEWACEVHFFEEPDGNLEGLYNALLFVLDLLDTGTRKMDIDTLVQIHSIYMTTTTSRLRRSGEDVFAYKLNNLSGKPENKEIVVYTPGGSMVKTQMDELLCRNVSTVPDLAQWLRDFLHIHPFIDGNGRMAHLLWVFFTYNNQNKKLTSMCNYNFTSDNKLLHLNAKQIYILALQNDKFFTDWIKHHHHHHHS